MTASGGRVFRRAEELGQVATAMRRAGIVGSVLSGPAGIGKSRLLTDAAEHAAEQGFCVVRLYGSHATAELPLCAFNSFLTDVDAEHQTERFIAVRKALLARSEGRPLFIAVDDAHLLDDTSAVLVGQLAREMVAFVVCSVRAGEPAPTPISTLWTQGIATQVRLAPMDRTAVGELASDLLGGAVDVSLAAELHRRTSGNPLYIRELVVGSVASGALVEEDGVWRRRAALVPSDALSDLVRQRIGDLAPEQLHTLACVAFSEPAGIGLIEAVADADALVGLEEAGLVTATEDGRRIVVRLAHPMYGDVVRSMTSVLRARRIRKSLADAIAAFGARRQDDALRMARWRLDAGEVDATLFSGAAFDAMHRHDVELATALAEAAHRADNSDFTARAVAMTRHLVGRHDDASDVLAPYLEQLPPGSEQWAKVGLVSGLIRARGVGDFPSAIAVLATTERCVASPRVLRRASAMLAMIDLLRGLPVSCHERAARLVADGATEAEAHTAFVGSLTANGRPEAALRHADAFVADHGQPAARTLFPDFVWFTKIELGLLPELSGELLDAWERAVEHDDRHGQGRAALVLGHVALDGGRLSTARTWFERSTTLSRLTGERFGERWALAGCVLAASQMGDVETTERLLGELAAVESHPAEIFEVYAVRGHAWLAAARGEQAQARQELLELAERLLQAGTVAQCVRVLADVARLGDPAAAWERMPSSDQLDGSLLPALAGFVAAMHTQEPDRLVSAVGVLERHGHMALAAEAANAARDALSRRNQPREAAGCARRATELTAMTEGVATPWLAVVDSVVPLTRREREISALVALGRTSREVADACFLSVRTVETHLARVYDKLGVRTRAELAEALSSLILTDAT